MPRHISPKMYFLGILNLFLDNPPKYYLNVLYSKFIFRPRVDLTCNLKIMSTPETIKYCLENKKSIIRWGDGETRLQYSSGVQWQKHHPDLSKRLYKIIQEYDSSSPYIFCIPLQLKKSYSDLKIEKELPWWHFSKYYFNKFLAKNDKSGVIFGDAHIFHPRNKYIDEVDVLWKDSKNLILVNHNSAIESEVKQAYPKKKIYYVPVPSRHCFDKYDETIRAIKKIIADNVLKKEDTRILIAAGPAGKVMVYELNKEGFVTIDLGQYFDKKYLPNSPSYNLTPKIWSN